MSDYAPSQITPDDVAERKSRERTKGLIAGILEELARLRLEGEENGPGIEDEIEPRGDDEC